MVGEENQRRLGVVETPSGADDGGMFGAAHVPSEAHAGTELREIVRNVLGRRNHFAGIAFADPDGVSRNGRLRLRIRGAVPAETVGQSDAWGELPLVLPVEADSRLIIIFQGVGFEDVFDC